MGMLIKYMDDVKDLEVLVKFENTFSVTVTLDKDFNVPLTDKHPDHWLIDQFKEHLHDHGLIVLAIKANNLIGFACYNNHDGHVNLIKLSSIESGHKEIAKNLINYIEKVAIEKSQNLRIYCQRHLEEVASLGYSNLGEYWIKKLEKK